jgi:hypothetical protein
MISKKLFLCGFFLILINDTFGMEQFLKNSSNEKADAWAAWFRQKQEEEQAWADKKSRVRREQLEWLKNHEARMAWAQGDSENFRKNYNGTSKRLNIYQRLLDYSVLGIDVTCLGLSSTFGWLVYKSLKTPTFSNEKFIISASASVGFGILGLYGLYRHSKK